MQHTLAHGVNEDPIKTLIIQWHQSMLLAQCLESKIQSQAVSEIKKHLESIWDTINLLEYEPPSTILMDFHQQATNYLNHTRIDGQTFDEIFASEPRLWLQIFQSLIHLLNQAFSYLELKTLDVPKSATLKSYSLFKQSIESLKHPIQPYFNEV